MAFVFVRHMTPPRVRVTISSDLILEPSVFSGTLATEGEEYRINPSLKFKYAALIQNKQALPVDVTYRVEIDDQPVEEKTETIVLRSINDCPRMIVDGKSVTDLRFMFAAYVNEQHPFVEKVLREALDEGIVDSFSGYQSGETEDVYGQVYALWKALSKRDVRYSNITATAAASEKVYSQHVRLIDESINNAQANCVDGSVLFASLLRKVGIEPYLVLIPGHCYVAFQVDKQGKEIAALETTLIGASLEGDAKEVDELSDVVDEDEVKEASWVTFSAAFVVGRDNFQKHVEKTEGQRKSPATSSSRWPMRGDMASCRSRSGRTPSSPRSPPPRIRRTTIPSQIGDEFRMAKRPSTSAAYQYHQSSFTLLIRRRYSPKRPNKLRLMSSQEDGSGTASIVTIYSELTDRLSLALKFIHTPRIGASRDRRTVPWTSGCP